MINKNSYKHRLWAPYSDSRPFVRRLCRLSAGVLAMPAMLLTIATASATAATPCSDQLGSLSATNQPACWRPFTANSPVNSELPGNPQVAPNNAAVVQHMATYGWSFEAGSSGFQIDGNGSRPIYFASAHDPVMTVNCTSEYGRGTCQGANGINPNGAQIHVPAGAKPSNNGDAHMIIIETDTGQEYDFFHASISGSTLTAGTGSVENVTTTDGTKDNGDAAKLALTAGLLRPAELASGHIDHALAIDIPCTNANGPTVGYVWPATGGWGDYCGQLWNESATGAPNIGQLFRLNMTDAQIAASGAPGWEQTIMTALAHYGAYAEDTNGLWHHQGISIFTQDPISWTSVGQPNQWATTINALGGQNGALTSSIPIPTAKLQVVDPCVPQGLCPGAHTVSSPPVTASVPPATITATHHPEHPVAKHRVTKHRHSAARAHRARHHRRHHHRGHHHTRHHHRGHHHTRHSRRADRFRGKLLHLKSVVG